MAIDKSDFLMVLSGSVVDSISNRVPNFSSSSPATLEHSFGQNTRLSLVRAHLLPIKPDGTILLEPETKNIVTFNRDLGINVWQKGSNVNIRVQSETSPEGTPKSSDLVTWNFGTGINQVIKRAFALSVGRPYVFFVYLMAKGNTIFGPADEIRIVGDTREESKVSLSELNEYPDLWRKLKISFFVTGEIPQKLPLLEREAGSTVVSVTASTFTIHGEGVAQNDMVGAIVTFNNVDDKLYEVVSNTATNPDNRISVTVKQSTLVSDGVTTQSIASLQNPLPKNVTLEVYSESVASLAWGGCQMEDGENETSIVNQREEALVRAQTSMYFLEKDNVVADLRTFGVFFRLSLWRGNGNLLNGGNWQISIADKRLKVNFEGSTATDPDPLPTSPAILCQVSEETGDAAVYIDGKLRFRLPVTGFSANTANLVFTSDATIGIQEFAIVKRFLDDEKPEVKQDAGGDVKELFRNPFGADLTASSDATFILPVTRIPASAKPSASQSVSAINPTTRVVTLSKGTDYSLGGVYFVRNGKEVLFANVQQTTATTLTLDTVFGLLVGDVAVQGALGDPGRSFVRFPWSATDIQEILSVDANTKTVKVSATLGFSPQLRAIVQTEFFENIMEVVVESINHAATTMKLSSVSGIEPGYFIGQPKEGQEMLVSPHLYEVDFLVPHPDVFLEQVAENGIVVANSGFSEKLVTPILRISAL